MNKKNMTALVSAFARVFHAKNNTFPIYSEGIEGGIISESEYIFISEHMKKGIKFFNPNFTGSKEEALRWIVDNNLSPSVLARSILSESVLKNMMNLGCKQFIVFASGYDTMGYKKELSNINVFELDREEMILDKKHRIEEKRIDNRNVNYISCDFEKEDWIDSLLESKYRREDLSFSTLLGISYYLSKKDFEKMIRFISNSISSGSTIVFDYPTYDECVESTKNEELAKESKENMKSKYTYSDIELILEKNGLFIVEHLNNEMIDEQYFAFYNKVNQEHIIKAPTGVAYCIAKKIY